MNKVILIGRLGKDIELRYTDSQMAVGRFSLAVDRMKNKDSNDKNVDWISCVAFGKTAEAMEKYLSKGRKVAIEGHLQTGNYEKDGITRYTTDVIVEKFEFVDSKNANDNTSVGSQYSSNYDDNNNSPAPSGFTEVDDDDLPF